MSASALAVLLSLAPLWHESAIFHWDHLGHLFATRYSAEHLFPRFSGWNPHFFFGFAQGLYYPPLFHWLGALLAQAISVEASYRILVSAAIAAAPLTVFFMLRSFGLSSPAAQAGAAAFFTSQVLLRDFVGGNLVSTVYIGNVTEALSLPLLFAYLATLPRLTCGASRGTLSSLLLSLIVLTHMLTTMAALSILAGFCLTNVRSRRGGLLVFLHLALAGLLAAFWILPFFMIPHPEIHSSGFYRLRPWELALVTLALVHLLPRFRIRIVKAAPLLAGMLLILLFMVINTRLNHPIPFHYERSKFLLLSLSAISLAELIDYIPARCKHIYPSALAVWWCLLAAFLIWRPIPAGRLPLPALPPVAPQNGRTLVISDLAGGDGRHQDNYWLPWRVGADVAKGLFLESAHLSGYALGIETWIGHALSLDNIDTWGGYTIDRRLRRIPVRHHQIRTLLAHFGINYVLINSSAPKPRLRAAARLALPGGEVLVRIGNTKLAEPLSALPLVVSDNFDRTAHLQIRKGRSKPVLTNLPVPPGVSPARTERLTIQEVSNTQETIRFFVSGTRDIPILVKLAWAPQWRVEVNGHESTVFRASPSFILVYGHGSFTLRYGRHWTQRLGGILSMLGVLISVGLLLFPAAARPSPDL